MTVFKGNERERKWSECVCVCVYGVHAVQGRVVTVCGRNGVCEDNG